MTTWQHWMVGQLDASIVAVVLLAVAVLARHRLSPSLRAVLLTIALARLVLPPWINSPWSEAFVDLPPLDDSRFAMSELVRANMATKLFALWLAGALFCLGRLAFQAWHARRYWLETTVEAPARIAERVRQIAGDRAPDVRISMREDGPMAIGLRQPLIILPASLVDLPGEALDAVLAHEVAHHARRDLFWIAAASAMSALAWFNPVAHVIAAELRSAREDGSDDWAVMRTSREPYAYAQALLRSARLAAGLHSPLAAHLRASRYGVHAGAHPMGPRLRRLLDGSSRRDDRLSAAALCAILVVLTLALPGAHMPDPDDDGDERIVIVITQSK